MAVAIWTDRRQNQFMGEKRQTRHEQVQEAEKIFSWLVSQRQLTGDLIRTSAKIVDDKEEAADTRLDLHMIAKALAAATKPGSGNAVWQDYQHHFVSDEHRKKFSMNFTTSPRV